MAKIVLWNPQSSVNSAKAAVKHTNIIVWIQTNHKYTSLAW